LWGWSLCGVFADRKYWIEIHSARGDVRSETIKEKYQKEECEVSNKNKKESSNGDRRRMNVFSSLFLFLSLSLSLAAKYITTQHIIHT
jgi:hypothetical protein